LRKDEVEEEGGADEGKKKKRGRASVDRKVESESFSASRRSLPKRLAFSAIASSVRSSLCGETPDATFLCDFE